jgi:hypothetical protein
MYLQYGHVAGSIRWLIAGLLAASALSSAGNAFAKTYEPSLTVSFSKYTLGTKTGVGITLEQGPCCFAPGRITVYSPPGYTVKLDHSGGTELGWVFGTIRVGDVEQRAIAYITAESPLGHAGNSCAPGIHDAVWMLAFESAPYRFRVPMYVDRITAGPEAAFASARMIVCFASPHVAPPEGAPERIWMGGLALGIRGVFTSPARAGTYAWNAVFVPYAPGTATLSPDLGAQSTSYARLPVILDTIVKRLRRGSKTFVAKVCVHENGQPISGIRVQVVGQPRPNTQFTRYADVRTGASGCVTRRFRPKHKVTLGQVWTEPLRRAAPGCWDTLAARCSRPTLATSYFQRRFRIRL